MVGFELVAGVIGISFVAVIIMGTLIVTVLPRFSRRKILYRYKDSNLTLDPSDPDDAEKIVRRWLDRQDNSPGWSSE